jgi:hypothetical protein
VRDLAGSVVVLTGAIGGKGRPPQAGLAVRALEPPIGGSSARTARPACGGRPFPPMAPVRTTTLPARSRTCHGSPTSSRTCAVNPTHPSRPGRLMAVTACQDRHETPRKHYGLPGRPRSTAVTNAWRSIRVSTSSRIRSRPKANSPRSPWGGGGRPARPVCRGGARVQDGPDVRPLCEHGARPRGHDARRARRAASGRAAPRPARRSAAKPRSPSLTASRSWPCRRSPRDSSGSVAVGESPGAPATDTLPVWELSRERR